MYASPIFAYCTSTWNTKKACLLNNMHKPLLYGIVYTVFIWIYWSNSDDCKRLGLVLETRNEWPVVLPHSLYTILMILNEDLSFKRKKWRSFYDFFFDLAHLLHYTNTQLLSAIYLTTFNCRQLIVMLMGHWERNNWPMFY